MAVSPADFELYSRVTGRPVPTDRGARMKMAPEVNRFIKNREYERPQKTTLQKGADLLGKAAIIGGALAVGHAIGGGFRGKTAENVGKVADVVQNLAKTGVVGAEGGAGKPDTRIVDEWLNSPGNSSFVEYENAAKAATEMVPLSNEIYGALQQEEMLNNLAQPAVDVQTSVADRGTALADRILNRPGGDLDRLDNFVVDIPPNTGGGDTILPKKPDGSAQIVNTADEVDAWLAKNQWIRSDAGITGKGHGNIGQEKEWLKEELDARKELETGLTSEQRQQNYINTLGADEEEAERNWWNLQLDAMARDRDPDGPPPGGGGGGGPISPVAPQPTEIVATTPESSEVVSNEGGLRQRVEDFGNRAEQHVKDWWHLDNEKIGYQIQGALENENPLAGAAQVTGVIGPALAKQGLLNAGQTAQGLYGYGKEFMGDYIDTVRQGYKKAQDIALSDQIRRSSMGVGGGKVLGGDFSVSGSPLLYGMQNQLDQGWSRHDAAIAPLAKNLQAAFGITLPTGQVAIGENHQLTRTPRLQPSDTTLQVPSRAIQQFSDRRISGEGSLTPGDRSDLSALLSGSSAELGPDETVSGDIEIRTDVGVNDPVNFTSGFYDKTRRPSKGEKAKFISGLKERNKDIYSNASDLPARKVGGKGKMGTSGLAGSMAGVSDWESRDAKDPFHGLKQFAAGLMEEPDLSDNAAEEVGKRMAEREQQGNLFEDDKEQQQGSTKWVRSPDGKLRRKKIDDPWDS